MATKTTTTGKLHDVKDVYARKSRDITAKLVRIQKALNRHRVGSAAPNWAHVGDLNHVDESLSEILGFLTR